MLRSSAHWKYSRLCRPERKTKWPSSSEPVLRKSASRSSLIWEDARRWRAVFGGPPKTYWGGAKHANEGGETIVRHIHKEPFDEPSNGARQRRALPRFRILTRCIIGGLIGLGRGGNYLDFHVSSSRQRGNLDGRTARGILFEIRAVYLVYSLKIAEAR